MAKYCSNCGEPLKDGADICLKCGKIVNDKIFKSNTTDPNAKSKIAAGLLAIFLGYFGVHNFYLGYTNKGIAQLLMSFLSCFALLPVTIIWGIIEGILILTGSINKDSDGRPLTD